MLNQTSEYAIIALSAMARSDPGKYIKRRDLAQMTGVPSDYLAKVLRTLAHIGIVSGQKGKHGGFTLLPEGEKKNLADVVAAFEKPGHLSRCILGSPACDEHDSCLLHERWAPVREAMRIFLEETTVGDLRLLKHMPAKLTSLPEINKQKTEGG